MRIVPLGGLGQIGRNMNVIEYNGLILLIACGVLFPEDESRAWTCSWSIPSMLRSPACTSLKMACRCRADGHNIGVCRKPVQEVGLPQEEFMDIMVVGACLDGYRA